MSSVGVCGRKIYLARRKAKLAQLANPVVLEGDQNELQIDCKKAEVDEPITLDSDPIENPELSNSTHNLFQNVRQTALAKDTQTRLSNTSF